ncbi:MAG: C69 family dipeptidase [Bacillota bacterium]|jgi:secernin|nr:C69 family dipeptidase [Bacillota bacterium]HHT90400.1 peptidase U34 [Bacillota bacterium]
MCDTMVALGNSTKDGHVIFAKNSDRQPNEPLLMLDIPRQQHAPGSQVHCTYISVDQVRETYRVLLFKPSWMWGAEMGANEFGLNIGNEAVFTKVRQGPNSLLGMDLVRLALERCKTSTEALHLMTDLLAKHGQGGNCGYEKRFVYHNSFLIADRNSAWVLETAGPYWAAQKVHDVRAISNRLSIGRDFDLAHPELVDYAVSKKWCRNANDFDFARCYSNHLVTRFSGSQSRQGACSLRLHQEKGQITVETMMEILRSHEQKLGHQGPFRRSSLGSVCMHGGGLVGDHTTGSYIASLSSTLDTYWVTGSSTPCISVFKPYWMTENEILFDREQGEALHYWLFREEFHRLVLQNKVDNLDNHLRQGADLERKALDQAASLGAEAEPGKLNAIMAEFWQVEEKLVQTTVEESRWNQGNMKGSPYFRHYWKKQTKKLGF